MIKTKLYVASSWRNAYYPGVVNVLRAGGYSVYDFRNPPNCTGFSWSQVFPGWSPGDKVELSRQRLGLLSTIAKAGFASDRDALADCEACVLVLPCGRSAHLEAGVAVGNGKPLIIFQSDPEEPELMYGFATAVVGTCADLMVALARWTQGKVEAARG